MESVNQFTDTDTHQFFKDMLIDRGKVETKSEPTMHGISDCCLRGESMAHRRFF